MPEGGEKRRKRLITISTENFQLKSHSEWRTIKEIRELAVVRANNKKKNKEKKF